jgi:hypothetical protein
LGAGDKIARISDITSAIPTASVAAVRSSGVLDELDFKTIAAASPFILQPTSKVFTKGNICYVAIVMQLPAQVTAPVSVDGVNIIVATGLPLNPFGTNGEGGGILTVNTRHKRATQTNDAGSNRPYESSVGCISASGQLLIAGAYNLVGHPTLGYNEYITISGHYAITSVDAVP